MAAKNRICTLKCDHHDPETETAGWLSPPARSEAERFSAKGTATHFLAGRAQTWLGLFVEPYLPESAQFG
jgi:hypothetical protein